MLLQFTNLADSSLHFVYPVPLASHTTQVDTLIFQPRLPLLHSQTSEQICAVSVQPQFPLSFYNTTYVSWEGLLSGTSRCQVKPPTPCSMHLVYLTAPDRLPFE